MELSLPPYLKYAATLPYETRVFNCTTFVPLHVTLQRRHNVLMSASCQSITHMHLQRHQMTAAGLSLSHEMVDFSGQEVKGQGHTRPKTDLEA